MIVGRLAGAGERSIARENPRREAVAGTFLWLALVGGSALLAIAWVWAAGGWALAAVSGHGPAPFGLGLPFLGVALVVVYLVGTTLWLKSLFALRTLVRFCERPLGRPLEEMRTLVAGVVNRPTQELDAVLLHSALIESAVENTTDSVVSPLTYYGVFGLPGMVAYRAINTLDALVGHRDRHWRYVGQCSATMDHAANYFPDRLAALLFRGVSPARGARVPAVVHSDPDQTISATILWISAVLGVRLERRGSYVVNPDAREPTADDVHRALVIVRRTATVSLGIALLLLGVLTYVGWTYLL